MNGAMIRVRRYPRFNQLNTVVDSVADIKALRNRPGIVIRDGFIYQWVANSTATADDAFVVQPTHGAPGRYILEYAGDPPAQIWECKGDANREWPVTGTDDTANLARMSVWANANKRRVVGGGRCYRISSPVAFAHKFDGFDINMGEVIDRGVCSYGASSRAYGLLLQPPFEPNPDPNVANVNRPAVCSPNGALTRDMESFGVTTNLGFAEGQQIFISQDVPWGAANASKSEFATVLRYVADTVPVVGQTGVLTLKAPLQGNYAAAAAAVGGVSPAIPAATINLCPDSVARITNCTFYGRPARPMPANCLSSTVGTRTVTVDWPAHGLTNGQFLVVFGATGGGGWTDAQVSREWTITVVNANQFTYQVQSTTPVASSTQTGFGGTLAIAYDAQAAFIATWFQSITVDNVECINTNHAGVTVQNSSNVRMNGVKARYLKGNNGYCIALAGVNYTNIDGTIADDCRHGITHGAGIFGAVNRHCVIGSIVGRNMRDATLDAHPGIAEITVGSVNHHGTIANEDLGDAVIIQGGRVSLGKVTIGGCGRNAVNIQPYGDGDGQPASVYVESIHTRQSGQLTGFTFTYDDAQADMYADATHGETHNSNGNLLHLGPIDSVSSRGISIYVHRWTMERVNVMGGYLEALSTTASTHGIHYRLGTGVTADKDTGRIKHLYQGPMTVKNPTGATQRTIRLQGIAASAGVQRTYFDSVLLMHPVLIGGGDFCVAASEIDSFKMVNDNLSGYTGSATTLTNAALTKATFA